MAETETKAPAKASTPAKAPAKAPTGQHVPETADPAAAKLTAAVESAERDRLLRELDTLTERIGADPEDMPLSALRAMVGALSAAVARMGVPGPGFVSAGVAGDLERVGYSVDPSNGDVYVRDGETGNVTRIERGTGKEHRVDMPEPAVRPDSGRPSVKAD
jgi:hypothetical protein